MKRTTKMKITAALAFFLGLGIMQQVQAQTTTWKFDEANNSGYMIQISAVGLDHVISKVELGKKGDLAWTPTEILHKNAYGTYVRIKSGESGKTYELNINWYDGKISRTAPDGSIRTYWLRKV